MGGPLARMVRSKYPGAYDDLSDEQLEKAVTAKFPGVYDDLLEKPKPAQTQAPTAQESRGWLSPTRGAEDFPVYNMVKGAAKAVAAIPGAVYDLATDVAPYDEQGRFKFPLERTVRGIVESSKHVGGQAVDAYRKGDYFRAAVKGVEAFPVFGPMLSAAGDKMEGGNVAEGIGELAMNAYLMASPLAPKTTKGGVVGPVLKGTSNAKDAAAIKFAQQHGVTVDAGTATGSNFIKTVQEKAANNFGGYRTAESMKQAQAEQLTKLGGKMAENTGEPVTNPLAAGESVRNNLQNQIRLLHERASTEYGKLRQLEGAAPEEMVVQAAPRTAAKGLPPEKSFLLRWLADDLNEMPYQKGGSTPKARRQAYETLDPEEAQALRFNPSVAGTPTQEMFHAMGLKGSRAEIAAKIDKVLSGKASDPKLDQLSAAMSEAWDGSKFDFDLVSDNTLNELGVRRRDLKSPITLPDYSAPGAHVFFPEHATNTPSMGRGVMESQKLSVPIVSAKPMLRQALEPLLKKRELTGSLMGSEGRAAVALDALVNGPDYAPLSVVDSALSDIKAMARGADMPELRTPGQSIAARVVQVLDGQVRARARAAGPDVLSALENGRAATKQKHAVSDALDMLSGEPGQVFEQLTRDKDLGIERLRAVQRVAPEEVPKLGRAFIEDLMKRATAEGGFANTGSLWADWQRLGSETKRAMFPKKGQVADLDNFFLLSKRLGEVKNPSGTARVAGALDVLTAVPSWALAKMLMTPGGVKALTTAHVASRSLAPSARVLALSNLTKAAQSAGVSLDAIPAFAGDSASTPPERRK